MWSEFYVFINSKKRFVKIEMRSSTAKHLTQEQIYEILRLYSKCELPVHPVVGAFKEKRILYYRGKYQKNKIIVRTEFSSVRHNYDYFVNS